jgi:alcohol dehydrogenase class IV
MSRVSLYGGLCLGPVNTAAGHALAYPLGSEYHIPHGVSVAIVQPHVFRFNSQAAPERHAKISRALGVPEGSTCLETAQAGAAALTRLTQECGVNPHLNSYGIGVQDVSALATSALKVGRLLRNNVRTITNDDCIEIYKQCFECPLLA